MSHRDKHCKLCYLSAVFPFDIVDCTCYTMNYCSQVNYNYNPSCGLCGPVNKVKCFYNHAISEGGALSSAIFSTRILGYKSCSLLALLHLQFCPVSGN